MPNTSRAIKDFGGAKFLPPEASPRSGLYKLGLAYVFAAIALDLQFFQGAEANMLLILVAIALIVYQSPHSREKLLLQDGAYLFWFISILFSAFWSINPPTTLEQAVPMIVPWISTLLLSALPAEWVAKVIVRCAIAAAVLSPLMIVIIGDSAYQPISSTGAPELRGIFAHQLFLGAFLTIALGLIVVSHLNGQVGAVLGHSNFVKIGVVLLLLGVLVLSRTRLYVATGAVALLMTWLLSRRGSRKWVALNGLAIIGVTVTLSYGRIIEFLEASGFDTTLTGRTRVWEKALSAIRSGNELLGYGYGTFQLPYFDYLWGEFRPRHAHNSFLNVYFETGLIGLATFTMLVIAQLFVAWRFSVRSNKYSYSLFLVLFCAFGGLAGGALYSGALTASFCIMMLFIAIESRTGPNLSAASFVEMQPSSAAPPGRFPSSAQRGPGHARE